MPRPLVARRLGASLFSRVLTPVNSEGQTAVEVLLAVDEAEALRLADLEKLYQEAAARSMGVSRQTFGRILEAARHKVADAVLNGKTLRIQGGESSPPPQGDFVMKIAIPARDGLVDQHFGHCKEFMVFTSQGEELRKEDSIPSGESCGCKSGIAGVLAKAGVTHLLAGNMGEGAVNVVRSHGIQVVRGAAGAVRPAVEAFVAGGFQDSGRLCRDDGHSCQDSATQA
ncbi:MAG: DUF134 domain-containing protein [Spirochaetales bacterium]|nr:DUF134 domain-containing protein [Spirochaetales bacterium]